MDLLLIYMKGIFWSPFHCFKNPESSEISIEPYGLMRKLYICGKNLHILFRVVFFHRNLSLKFDQPVFFVSILLIVDFYRI